MDPLADHDLARDRPQDDRDDDPDDPKPEGADDFQVGVIPGAGDPVGGPNFCLVNVQSTESQDYDPRSDSSHNNATRSGLIAKKTRIEYSDKTKLKESENTRLDIPRAKLNPTIGNKYQSYLLPSINHLTLMDQVSRPW